MRAAELCDLASDWLALQHPAALIVRELSVGKWGKAMIDIAAILPDRIVGVEIKGEGDSPARLERQGWVYARVAANMFLLPCPGLDAAAERHKPPGWWLLKVDDGAIDHGNLGVTTRWGHTYAPDTLPNAPAALLECLITRELKLLGRELVPEHDIGRTVPTMIEAISEHAPLAAIRSGVCGMLRRRDWLKWDRSTDKDRPDRYRWADGRELVGAAAHRDWKKRRDELRA